MKVEFQQNGFTAEMNTESESEKLEKKAQNESHAFDDIKKNPDLIIAIISLAVTVYIFVTLFFLPLVFEGSVLTNPIFRTISTICGGIIIVCLFAFELFRFLKSPKKNYDLPGMVICSISLLLFIATTVGIIISN